MTQKVSQTIKVGGFPIEADFKRLMCPNSSSCHVKAVPRNTRPLGAAVPAVFAVPCFSLNLTVAYGSKL